MAVDQDRWGREGTRRTGGDGWWLTTDLAVGGSNPSRRATETAAQRPCNRVAACCRAAGLRPNCDPVGGHSAHRCDPLRPHRPQRRRQPGSRHPPAAAVGDRAALGIPTSSRQTSLSCLKSWPMGSSQRRWLAESVSASNPGTLRTRARTPAADRRGIGRDLGGPSARAACGGNLSLPWLPRTVVPQEQRDRWIKRRCPHALDRLGVDAPGAWPSRLTPR
jgi:hypothetical protein